MLQLNLQLQQKQFLALPKFHTARPHKPAPLRPLPLQLTRVTFGLCANSVSRFFLCRAKDNSDIISQLELGKPEEQRKAVKRVNGIFWILLLNIGIYVADHVFQVPLIKELYLYHNNPAWYQFITSTFCHFNWSHLSSNLFFLYIFGKLVEEEEGNFALWISYILTGAGANLVSWLVLPRNAVSIGASGAVFGLFAVSVLVKMSWDWRKILEVLILGQFVVEKVMEAAQASASLGGSFRGGAMQNVNHIAHLSGALIGVVLIWLLSSVPTPTDEK
ncbi:rhomboid-like protein 11, chloroplastic isoform X2 [Salvia hispanica]|uniref:rhomboid-like protein 11, chloroplastic isoform X2 n=1 Tax=Salvia hispanica TaxID=49212 RepID=UPI002009D720|nr:rhomboid-like protein 11, chloroplastic isoform X2 [Salvia hispanica]